MGKSDSKGEKKSVDKSCTLSNDLPLCEYRVSFSIFQIPPVLKEEDHHLTQEGYDKETYAEKKRGQVVNATDLKSDDLEFKSRSNHELDLFQLYLVQLLRCLYKGNWSVSCQLGFLTCLIH